MKLYMRSYSKDKGYHMTILDSEDEIDFNNQDQLQHMIRKKTQRKILKPVLGVIDGGNTSTVEHNNNAGDAA